MKKSYLTNTLLILLLISCKSLKPQSAIDFMKVNSQTHIVKNNEVLNIIDKKKRLIDNTLYDVIVLKIDSISNERQDIYIKASNFDLEKKYCFTDIGCERPEGYFIYNNIPILLYGELDAFFKRIKETKNILKSDKEELILIEMDGEYSLYEYQKYQIYNDVVENTIYKGDFSSKEVRKRLE